jgi:peptidoglycan/LPS O-acetylase OafA/YrhL
MLSQIKKLLSFSDSKIDLKINSFDFIRLLLAIVVVFSHSAWVGYRQLIFTIPAKDMQSQIDLGQISVFGFFAISGFLIANSWIRSKDIVDFMQKRFYRLFPGYWVCIFICVSFFAPLYFVLNENNLFDYFGKNGLNSTNYFWKNILLDVKTRNIGDILKNTTNDEINGPLWSLIFEFRAYILLAIFGIIGIFKNKFTIFLPFLFFWYSHYNVVFNPEYRVWFETWVGDYKIAILFSYFFAGAVFLVWKDKIIMDWKLFVLALISLIYVVIIDQFALIASLSFTYITIYLAAVLPIRNLSKKIGDWSYGIYIYSWPIQNLLFLLGVAKLGLWPYTFISIVVSCGAGWLSWNFIEKRFLVRHRNLASEKPLN